MPWFTSPGVSDIRAVRCLGCRYLAGTSAGPTFSLEASKFSRKRKRHAPLLSRQARTVFGITVGLTP